MHKITICIEADEIDTLVQTMEKMVESGDIQSFFTMTVDGVKSYNIPNHRTDIKDMARRVCSTAPILDIEAIRLLREYFITYPIIRNGIALHNDKIVRFPDRTAVKDLDALDSWVYTNIIRPATTVD